MMSDQRVPVTESCDYIGNTVIPHSVRDEQVESIQINPDRLEKTGVQSEWTLRKGVRNIVFEMQSTAAINS